jgi:hypothetical protein
MISETIEVKSRVRREEHRYERTYVGDIDIDLRIAKAVLYNP